MVFHWEKPLENKALRAKISRKARCYEAIVSVQFGIKAHKNMGEKVIVQGHKPASEMYQKEKDMSKPKLEEAGAVASMLAPATGQIDHNTTVHISSIEDLLKHEPAPLPKQDKTQTKKEDGRKKNTPLKTAITSVSEIDLSLPLKQRPIIGEEVENWRIKMGITQHQAYIALGLNSMHAYSEVIKKNDIVPFTLEVLLRLYMLSPTAPGWERYSFRELFDALYREQLMKFQDHPELLCSATVGFTSRFTALFNRSKSRAYQWFAKPNKMQDGAELNAYADIGAIMSKLKSMHADKTQRRLLANPHKIFEKTAIYTWQLRGVDIDNKHPLPTVERMSKKRRGPGWDNVESITLWTLLRDPLPQKASSND